MKGYDTHLEPLSVGKGWLHPTGEEDGGHSQDGPGNDHEDTVCPNETVPHSVRTDLPSISHEVHSGSTDGGI